ncbi:hypothetical protein RJT34_16372 [Clitoria ternatea]|uniref:Homeobox-leucine zipper protein n=1 Tax=Clitoria ternatea TaxID=43366 RepID=A0AAN9J719_CLITE
MNGSTHILAELKSLLDNSLKDGSTNKINELNESLSLSAAMQDIELPLPPLAFAPLQPGIRINSSGIKHEKKANVEEDLSNDGSQEGEKKKRLNTEQVKAIEKSFELGNKLEPERKIQLARALG